MAVPAEIRAVPRPVNTIVDDSGTNSPKRYAVRQRASSKYIPGGNPQPKNGKVIGHIIDYKYVPLTDSTASDGPDMLSYGASALVKSVSADLLSDLLNIYPANEAYSIMSIATLRVIRPKITLGRMATHRTGRKQAEGLLSAAYFICCRRSSYRHRWNVKTEYQYRE